MKIKTVSIDFLYSCGAQVLLNGVQHLLVFPWINKMYGPEFTGRVLACLSIVYIFATTFGLGMNNVRLVEERKGNGSNGDYLSILLLGSVFLTLIAFSARRFGFDPQVNFIWFAILCILNMTRIYGEVDFRIKLHFGSYFIYYALISIGYILGFLLFRQTNNWTHIFIVGELLSIIMLSFRQMIFASSLPSKKFLYLTKSVILLFLSSIMVQIIISGDRLILKYFLGDRAVTVYSSLSLAAKIANMVVIPLGTLLLAYLTANTIPKTKSWLYKVSFAWIGLCLCALVGTSIASPIYVKLFYSNLYNEIVNLNLVVNIGLILAMIGYLYRIYLIATSNSLVVFLVESSSTIIHVTLAIILTKKYGMVGYAWSVIISRIIRIILGSSLTFLFINTNERNAKTQPCHNYNQ